DLHSAVDTDGRSADRRSDFDSVYGDWTEVAARAAVTATGPARPTAAVLDSAVLAGLKLAATDPAALLREEHEDAALALLESDGTALDELARIADELRREAVGEDVTYV